MQFFHCGTCKSAHKLAMERQMNDTQCRPYIIGTLPAAVLTHPDEVRYLRLVNGALALVDADWYDILSKMRWTQGKRGLVRRARFDLKPTGTWLARFVTGGNDSFTHLNGDPLDCRCCNIVARHRRNKPYRRQQRMVVNCL
jgi:hypothetical protein